MIQPRRAVHAASLAISAVAGGAIASLLAWKLGGGAEAIGSIWLVTAMATLLGAWPAMIGGPMPASRFGALVMAGSGVRLLATLGLGLAIDRAAAGGLGGDERTAFWLGVVLAAVVVLIGDSAAAVSMLNRCAGDGGTETRE